MHDIEDIPPGALRRRDRNEKTTCLLLRSVRLDACMKRITQRNRRSRSVEDISVV